MYRREFIKKTTLATAGIGLLSTHEPPRKPFRLKKSLKFDMVKENVSVLEKFQLLKEIGFDGVELECPNDFSSDEILEAKKRSGLEIPGVICGATWQSQLSHADPAVRAKGVSLVKKALNDCRLYGGTTVLVIPGVVNKETTYQQAYERSLPEIRKIAAEAEKTGVRIALENVWNNFLLSPLEAAKFVDEINHPMVGWYFDVGNVLRYGWPEHWIQTLNKRILKIDMKEFSRKKQEQEGLWKGFDVEFMEGDCNWPAVNNALRQIGYNGWGSAEVPGGDRKRLAQISQLMDAVFNS
jgi:hexulose-6-phosphate isomerase